MNHWYLLLVKRIGSSSAAYVLVTTPILALVLSAWFEGYQWVWTTFAGVGMIILGNVVVLAPAALIDRVFCEVGLRAGTISNVFKMK